MPPLSHYFSISSRFCVCVLNICISHRNVVCHVLCHINRDFYPMRWPCIRPKINFDHLVCAVWRTSIHTYIVRICELRRNHLFSFNLVVAFTLSPNRLSFLTPSYRTPYIIENLLTISTSISNRNGKWLGDTTKPHQKLTHMQYQCANLIGRHFFLHARNTLRCERVNENIISTME